MPVSVLVDRKAELLREFNVWLRGRTGKNQIIVMGNATALHTVNREPVSRNVVHQGSHLCFPREAYGP